MGITVTAVFGGFDGESYADIPTVARTVGLAPTETRAARLVEMREIADFAKLLAVRVVALHLGFVPHDRRGSAYQDILAVTRDLCGHCGAHGQDLHLETGQETADALLQFIEDVACDNLFINFDPANMILYGTGEPIEALRKVGQYVRSVHCKDATWAKRRGEERLKSLGVDTLRPWDVVVDPLGRDALTPFEGGAELVAKSASTFARLDPRLAEMFATLGDGSTAQGSRDGVKLDLDSRKGKAPGGYQYMRDRIREPFIFMNAAGLHRDVETMIHEAGHAFHSILCRDEPLLHYRHSTIEFAEVASMSMELLSMPYWGGQSDSFYPDEADADRARRRQLEGSITMLGWIATIDAFQHWIYANPNHSQDQRSEHWRSLIERFGAMGHFVSWDGIETHRDSFWQRQSHLFSVPFYYIEYGITQLGAMQLWLRSLEEGEEVAIASYMKALRLGGSVPLPDLFEAAGLEFNFGPTMVQRIVTRVESELAKLPV